MYTVKVTHFDLIRDDDYVSFSYDFENVNEARDFYAMKLSHYQNDESVSVTTDCI